ncbi:UNKNOWN [Stylonychia lemnae]|uniref:Uncharacterized protein n=1 Tax=Stylonychia lemnae TaxID=5949 RepID=A0A078B1P6_STYLE|nr:UNKNOWN [Stylonychia lemnae]|eukprot:CDW88490.1 UNKNOWN [Stylonychia lemnae]
MNIHNYDEYNDFKNDKDQLVHLNQTFFMLNVSLLNDAKFYDTPHEILPRTDLVIQKQDSQKLIYVFLDRNLTLYRYNMIQQSDKNMEKDIEVQLNKSIVNDTCFDLQVRDNMKQSLVMFYGIFDQIKIRYLSFLATTVNINFDSDLGVKFMGNQFLQTIDKGIFLDEMFVQQKSNHLTFNQSNVFQKEYQIDLGPTLTFNKMIDYLPIENYKLMIAILLDNRLIVCKHPDIFYTISTDPQFSTPPQVIEYDLSDPDNIIIKKIYTAPDEFSNHIGLNIITVNNNYLVHVMEEITTRKQYLRIYSRTSNRLDIAKADYIFDTQFMSNTIAFDSAVFNHLIIRNEQKIKLIAIDDYTLTIDATNETLIRKYKNNLITCMMSVYNQVYRYDQDFNITFVDQNYTSVLSKDLGSPDYITNISLFYNCGDQSFKYFISDNFLGPNFELEIQSPSDDCDDGNCHFKTKNQEFKLEFESSFDISKCTFFQLYTPYQGGQEDNDGYILVCLNIEQNTIKSYTQNKLNNSFDLNNAIQLGEHQDYVFHSFNTQQRGLFYIVRNNHQWRDNRFEMHLFIVKEAIVWRLKLDSNDNSFEQQFEQTSMMTYNQEFDRGVMAPLDLNIPKQILVLFEVSFQPAYLREISSFELDTIFNLLSTQVIQGFASNNAIITQQSDSTVGVFETQSQQFHYKIQWMKTYKLLGEDRNILNDIDFKQGQYLILYAGENTIQVYLLTTDLRLVYQKQMPLFKDYSDFKFSFNRLQPSPLKKSFYEGMLSIVLEKDMEGINQISKRQVFIFCIYCEAQHDAFMLVDDLGGFFDDNNLTKIQLFKKGPEADFMFLASKKDKVKIFEVEVFNYIQARTGQEKYEALVAKCSQQNNLETDEN